MRLLFHKINNDGEVSVSLSYGELVPVKAEDLEEGQIILVKRLICKEDIERLKSGKDIITYTDLGEVVTIVPDSIMQTDNRGCGNCKNNVVKRRSDIHGIHCGLSKEYHSENFCCSDWIMINKSCILQCKNCEHENKIWCQYVDKTKSCIYFKPKEEKIDFDELKDYCQLGDMIKDADIFREAINSLNSRFNKLVDIVEKMYKENSK